MRRIVAVVVVIVSLGLLQGCGSSVAPGEVLVRPVDGADPVVKRWDLKLSQDKKFGVFYTFIGTDGKQIQSDSIRDFTGHQDVTCAIRLDKNVWKMELGAHLASARKNDQGMTLEKGSGGLTSIELPKEFQELLNEGSQSISMSKEVRTKTLPVELMRNTIKSADGTKSVTMVLSLNESASKDAK